MIARRWFVIALLAVCLAAIWLGVHRNQTGASSPKTPPPDLAAGGSSSHQLSASTPVVQSEPDATVLTNALHQLQGGDEWTSRWRKLKAEPRTTALDEDMATFFEELAVVDPLRAIGWADREPESDLRLIMLESALRGWGAVQPESAVAWSTSQTLMDQGQAMAAIFHGLARDVEKALQFTEKLSAADPDRSRDYGSYLVAALSDAGAFSEAAEFAAKGSSDVQTSWINIIYSRWADNEPKAVIERIAQLSDPATKRTAFDAAVSRWAKNDARAVAEYAITLSEKHERSFALSQALRSWSVTDAAETAAWLNRFDPSPEFDFGIAIVAVQPEALRQPQVAASWAESIVEPRLRVRVLASIVKEWAGVDVAAARHYAETSPEIRAEDRAGVLSAFEPDFNPISPLP